MQKKLIGFSILFFALFTISCADSDSKNYSAHPQSVPEISSDITSVDPLNSNDEDQSQQDITTPQILLFNGVGTSLSDWKSLEQIIKSMGITYRLVSSSALTSMSATELRSFKLILIPGGNSNTINSNLSSTTRIKVRRAVRDGGVSFLGICAGAFAAVGTDANSNTVSYYGFSVVLGNFLIHWYPNGNTSLIAAVPKITFADGSSRYLMWWDGPSTPEWTGGVIARYPGGKPAISQTWSGNGFVIVSGPHPEAPTSWQYDSGPDPDGTDFDISVKLISAALNRRPLPAY